MSGRCIAEVLESGMVVIAWPAGMTTCRSGQFSGMDKVKASLPLPNSH